MIGAFTLAMLFNRTLAIVFLGFISYLALKEYLSLIPTRRIDRGLLLFAYLAIPIQFYWAAIDWYGMFVVFIPVWMFLFFPALMALRGETQGSSPATPPTRSLAGSGSCSSSSCSRSSTTWRNTAGASSPAATK